VVAVDPYGAVATSVTATNLFRSSLLCHHSLQWRCAASTAACWCFAVAVRSLLPFSYPVVSCNSPTWHRMQCCLLSSPPSCLLSKGCLFLCSSPRGYDWCCWFAGSRLIVALHIFEILLLQLLSPLATLCCYLVLMPLMGYILFVIILQLLLLTALLLMLPPPLLLAVAVIIIATWQLILGNLNLLLPSLSAIIALLPCCCCSVANGCLLLSRLISPAPVDLFP